MDSKSPRARVLDIARGKGLARAADFEAVGIPRVYLQRMTAEGALARVGRGLYRLAGAPPGPASSLAEAALVQRRGVIGLVSALQFHELTTQTPHAVWMLLGPKDWAPVNPPVALKIVRASGAALTEGVERHQIEGVPVPITSMAKTVVDCFKHRNRIGLDVAVEALKDFMARRDRTESLDDLWRYAQIDRVANVIRPYVEALV